MTENGECIQKCIQTGKNAEDSRKNENREEKGTGTDRGSAPSFSALFGALLKKDEKKREKRGSFRR